MRARRTASTGNEAALIYTEASMTLAILVAMQAAAAQRSDR
jgi:hypothetical protein